MTFKERFGLFLIATVVKYEGTTAVPCFRNDVVIYILNNILKLKPTEFKAKAVKYLLEKV